MNRNARLDHHRRRSAIGYGAVLLAVAIAACGLSGCQIVTGLMLIAQGRPEVKSDFENRTGKSLREKGKQVLVLCTASDEIGREFSAVDLDLIAEVSRELKNQKINLIDSRTVAQWIDRHGGEIDDVAEIAHELQADFVVQIRLEQFRCHDPASPGMLQGKAQAKVQVFEFQQAVSKSGLRTTKRIYSTPFSLRYPDRQPVPSDRESASVFRKRFTDQVGDGIAKLFYNHRPDEDLMGLR
jgi:hypothetical protein